MQRQPWNCKIFTFTSVFRGYCHFGEVCSVLSHDCHLITTPPSLSLVKSVQPRKDFGGCQHYFKFISVLIETSI